MKQFFVGLITIIILAIVGFFAFRGITSLMSRIIPTTSPTPSASISPSPASSATPAATPKPSITPSPTYTPTTKGGNPVNTGTVKGATTAKTTTTTTTESHLTLTLVKTSSCPISYMTEVKDIKGPLTLKYVLNDGYSFGITVWKADGNELLTNTIYSGTSGSIKTISSVDYMKVRVESKTCGSNNDNWLTLTAER